MSHLRKRSSFVAGVTTLALLALPSLAFANPGSGPELVQRSGRTLRFEGSTRLRFTGDFQEPEERFAAAQSLLGRLDQCVPRLRTG